LKTSNNLPISATQTAATVKMKRISTVKSEDITVRMKLIMGLFFNHFVKPESLKEHKKTKSKDSKRKREERKRVSNLSRASLMNIPKKMKSIAR
jgi:hypothetical protein